MHFFRAYFSWYFQAADDDIESKLAAFRQRLAQPLGSVPRTEPSQPLTVHTPAKVNFTQAPQQVFMSVYLMVEMFTSW